MNDLISRQDAIDAVKEYFMFSPREGRQCAKAIERVPPAHPRAGKWIRTRTMTHDGELYCDQCEQEHPEQKIIWNFCPNCGSYNGGGQTE